MDGDTAAVAAAVGACEVQAEELQKHLAADLRWLDEFKWLHNAPVITFFTAHLHERIPSAWASVLSSCSAYDLARLCRDRHELGESLVADMPDDLCAFLAVGNREHAARAPVDLPDGPILTHALQQMKGATPKKRHESRRLVALLDGLRRSEDCEAILDIGAGSAYIGQLLRLSDPTARYVGVEGNQSIHAGATARDERVLRQRPVQRLAADGQINATGFSIVHGRLEWQQHAENEAVVTRALRTIQTVNHLDLAPDRLDSASDLSAVLMTGLHCCGDLTPSMLTSFAEHPGLRSLAVVGCCYHGLSLQQGRTYDWFCRCQTADALADGARQARADQVLGSYRPAQSQSQPSTTNALPGRFNMQPGHDDYHYQPALVSGARVFAAFPMSAAAHDEMRTTDRFRVIDPFSMRRASASNLAKTLAGSPEDCAFGVRATLYRTVVEEVLDRHPNWRIKSVRFKLSRLQYGPDFESYLAKAFENCRVAHLDEPVNEEDLAAQEAARILVMDEIRRTFEHRAPLEAYLRIFLTLQAVANLPLGPALKAEPVSGFLDGLLPAGLGCQGFLTLYTARPPATRAARLDRLPSGGRRVTAVAMSAMAARAELPASNSASPSPFATASSALPVRRPGRSLDGLGTKNDLLTSLADAATRQPSAAARLNLRTAPHHDDLSSTQSLLNSLLPMASAPNTLKSNQRHPGRRAQPSATSHGSGSSTDMADVERVQSSLHNHTSWLREHLKPLDGALAEMQSTTTSSPAQSNDVHPNPTPSRTSRADRGSAQGSDTLADFPNLAEALLVLDRSNAHVDASVKPAVSFNALIALALLEHPRHRMTVSEIYSWFQSNFPYFSSPTIGMSWKNSIRHNLSSNRHFVKVEREDDSHLPMKGACWTLLSESLVFLAGIKAQHAAQSPSKRMLLTLSGKKSLPAIPGRSARGADALGRSADAELATPVRQLDASILAGMEAESDERDPERNRRFARRVRESPNPALFTFSSSVSETAREPDSDGPEKMDDMDDAEMMTTVASGEGALGERPGAMGVARRRLNLPEVEEDPVADLPDGMDTTGDELSASAALLSLAGQGTVFHGRKTPM
ncbi:uncharacterized protein MONBRDRAFT_31878 [Monosiga brevicollis MX1]|uniref:Fork-head domain-containing protein n=1 Tax=Monosiga brevicollis TaxID=81824 RepID=A9UVZ7_MONBE|nr:uncharacterized protein MONBRDRAFT_31878 [Monosiga brevicollis MX1]EDQ90678.1 predicted protein [Monosiga brevicollis MX1]|eukprot:XP_001744729.1 hypothetical protein [Monosiga brevicollis MX1]